MTVRDQVPERLPKGPHKLSREQVRASQRQRLLDAVLDVVGEKGYAAATVADVTAAAGVSRTTFYEQFRNKGDAFLQAYDEFGEQFLADITRVDGDHPAAVLAESAERLVAWGKRRPYAARAFLLEIYALGEEGLERRDRVMRRAEELFNQVAAWLRSVDPSLPPPPPALTARAVVAASWELAAQGVRTNEDTSADTREALAYIWLLGLTARPAV